MSKSITYITMMDTTSKKLVGLSMGIGILAVIVLMALAVTSGFGYALRKDTTAVYSGITVATNGSLTSFGSTYPYVQTVTNCLNSTATLTEANYTVVEGTGANGGFILADGGASFVGESINCTVGYKANTDASTAGVVFITAIIIIATFATVIALAIMGGIIYKMFKD